MTSACKDLDAHAAVGHNNVPWLPVCLVTCFEVHRHCIAGASRAMHHRALAPSMQDDLGSEHQISAMFERLAKGHVVPGVKAFRSHALSASSACQQVHLDGRPLLKSSKNLQLQVLRTCTVLHSAPACKRHCEEHCSCVC